MEKNLLKPPAWSYSGRKLVRGTGIFVTIGERIRATRKERGLTQDELADRVGMNGRHLSRIETGRLTAPRRTLLRIAEALELPIEELSEGNPSRTGPPTLPDPELYEQFQAVSKMEEEDRKAVKRILAAMIVKQQMEQVLSGRAS